MMQQGFRGKRSWIQGIGVVGAVMLLACGGADPEPEPEPQPEPEVVPVTPIAHSQVLEVHQGRSLPITLAGEAGPHEAVVYTLEDGPRNGQLEGTAPDFTYVPDAHFLGIDAFTFSVRVGDRTSSSAVVMVEVLSAPFYSITTGYDDVQSELHYTDERGRTELVGPTGHALVTLKFDPTDGTLFAATRRDDFEAKCNLCLVTLDPATGAATVVGTLDLSPNPPELRAVPELAFTPDGALYGISAREGAFLKIDKATAEVTVLQVPEIDSWGHGMWTDAEGTLWFLNGDRSVYTYDPSTGTPTLVHEASVLEASAAPLDGSPARGDLNPYTGRFWGAALGHGRVVELQIDAEQAQLVTFVQVGAPSEIHNLAFAPIAP